MASNENDSRIIRGNTRNHLLRNGELDEEQSPEDQRISSSPSNLKPPIGSPSCEALPSKSVTQTPARSTLPVFPPSQNRPRPAPATAWMWDYFQVTEVKRPWVMKRDRKLQKTDRDIRCVSLDEKTGVQCNWKTSDSLRQTSTSNMKRHLAVKHSIFPPGSVDVTSKPPQKSTILDFWPTKNPSQPNSGLKRT
ncbi:hypothetical protein N7535_003760 [Penicillium sp. DV-2018c]|nr:hypothetical protein N7461_000541 [Penicillium sp. DV-2018c]KAJ5576834.1 hypothetical protein N7535_003760 [Penicillium sp. DV-2018c]